MDMSHGYPLNVAILDVILEIDEMELEDSCHEILSNTPFLPFSCFQLFRVF